MWVGVLRALGKVFFSTCFAYSFLKFINSFSTSALPLWTELMFFLSQHKYPLLSPTFIGSLLCPPPFLTSTISYSPYIHPLPSPIPPKEILELHSPLISSPHYKNNASKR